MRGRGKGGRGEARREAQWDGIGARILASRVWDEGRVRGVSRRQNNKGIESVTCSLTTTCSGRIVIAAFLLQVKKKTPTHTEETDRVVRRAPIPCLQTPYATNTPTRFGCLTHVGFNCFQLFARVRHLESPRRAASCLPIRGCQIFHVPDKLATSEFLFIIYQGTNPIL